MRYIKSSNCKTIEVHKKIKLHLFWGQRSAGRNIFGPVFYTTEFHNYPGLARYWNLTVGNPKVHARWAFNFYIYF